VNIESDKKTARVYETRQKVRRRVESEKVMRRQNPGLQHRTKVRISDLFLRLAFILIVHFRLGFTRLKHHPTPQ